MRAIRSKGILSHNGWFDGTLLIENGKVTELLRTLPSYFSGEIDDFDNLAILPGIVDTHVHINEPGRTDWEGYETATHAAAAGGITTLVDMPLNCTPVTTTVAAFQAKLKALNQKLTVDCGFWGGVTPGSINELAELSQAGILGVKSFLIDSGIDDFPEMKLPDLQRAMSILKNYNLPYLLHAELDGGEADEVEITNEYSSFLRSRPRSFENNAIQHILTLTEMTGCRSHIVHLSSSDALPLLKQARKKSIPISVETCPHYLLLSSEDIRSGETLYKCCPPIRESENREALWTGINEGTIDFIVSDHSPCTPNLKLLHSGDLKNAWGGISSLQFSFSLIWTESLSRNVKLDKLSQLMSHNPAIFCGLDHRKGLIAPG